MNLSLNNSNKDFDFVGWVIKTPWLIYFRSVKFTLWKKHTDVSSVLASMKIVVASQHKRQRKKSLSRLVDIWKHRLGLEKLVHALHYANELFLRVRLAIQKLLQTRQTSRNYHKQVLVMIKHCLGNSQINSIPAWSKEFSYITFLYRGLQNSRKSLREQILFIHNAKWKKFSTLKTHPFIN